MNRARKLLLAASIAAFTISFFSFAAEKESTAKEDAKEVGRAVGSVLREIGHGTKEAGKAVGHAAKEGVEAVKEGGRELKKAVKGEK